MNGKGTISTVSATLVLGFALLGDGPVMGRPNLQTGEEVLQALNPLGGLGILVSGDERSAWLSWQPANDQRIQGYYVWRGTAPNNLASKKVGKVTYYQFDNLAQGQTWYFAVSSYGKDGKKQVESELSNIVSKYIPPKPGKTR